MTAMIRMELKKSFCSRSFILSLIVGSMIAAISAVYNISIYLNGLREVGALTAENADFMEICTLYNHWMGGEAFSLGSAIYFYIFPLLAALPYGWSCCEEKNSGYRRMLIVRCGKKNYMVSKCAAVFVSGGAAMTLPLALNFIATALFIPMVKPFPLYCVNYGVYGTSLMSKIYYTRPLLYVLLYLCLDFVFVGLIACLSMVFSSLIRFKVLNVILPMFVCLGIHYGRQFFYLSDEVVYNEISPLFFLRGMEAAYPACWQVIITEMLILFIIIVGNIVRECRHEIY